VHPDTTLLVDTYDTLAAVRLVVRLARDLGREFPVGGIRLDSGDLGDLAREARAILDGGGLKDVDIFASGDLDEYTIAELLAAGAPIDGFGVGTHLVQSTDSPGIDLKYKLVEYAGSPRSKSSAGKAYLPGRKQTIRRREDGRFVGDAIVLRAVERGADAGAGLLRPLVRGGRPCAGAPTSLADVRAHVASQLAALPLSIRGLDRAEPAYPVVIGPELDGDSDIG
jgi:nicotinate phosphoribosyltransferase